MLNERLFVNDVVENTVGFDEFMQEFSGLEYEKSFANIIEQGMKSGEFKKMNVSVALFTMLSSIRWIELWYKPSREITPQELEEDLKTLLMNGLNS